MPAIRISGMASGLPPDIVDQIMNAEKIPVKNLESKKGKEEDLLKLVGEFETKITDITKNLGELVGIRGFTDTKLTSGDPNILDGTADPAVAGTGDYSIEVMRLAEKPGAESNGFPDKDKTQLGVGYLKFNTGEGQKEIYINPKNNTLEGVAKQINASGYGLRAMVVDDRKDKENPYRLLVTGLATGDDKQISFPTTYMLDGDQDFRFEKSKPGVNAKIKLDGFEMELPENAAKDVIPGVTLDLKQAQLGHEVRVSVKENTEAISGKVKSFVDAYNAALGWIQNQHKLQKGTNGKQSLGPLGGDSLLRTAESKLRGIIQNPTYGVQSPIKQISELGIQFNRNGTLDFSEEKFKKAIAASPQAVGAFLRGDGFNTGFITNLKREIGEMTSSAFGPIAQRKKGLQDKVDQLNKQIDNKGRQLEKKEDNLRKKFADLESKMSQLNSQGSAVGAMAKAGGQ